jgi:glycosyltransferase involved in cell wall biosynthesis
MGEYAQFASIPRREERHGIDIRHPRFLRIPKVGMSVAPLLMAVALRRELERWNLKLPFDLIDAHYFYPDGVAAVLLGKWLNKPVVITARGTDINLIPKYRLPRRWILWAAGRCAGMIAVSDALRGRMVEIGVDADKVTTLRNGVDLELFCPLPDRSRIRSDLGMNRFTLLSVGHLIERKGHHLVMEALRHLPEVDLLIVGSGYMHGKLQTLARATGVADRVKFVGTLRQDELRAYYNAADALVLASSREGMANVLLESIACGTPAVATPFWGSPEVISTESAGQLTRDRSPHAIVEAILALREAYPSRADTRRHAEGFDWRATTDGQIELFGRICGDST